MEELTVWFPAAGGYRTGTVAEPVVLDVFCRDCGPTRPRRLARFARARGGGPVGVVPFRVRGDLKGPACWRSRGETVFRLVCPHRHAHRKPTAAEIGRALDAVAAGRLPSTLSI